MHLVVRTIAEVEAKRVAQGTCSPADRVLLNDDFPALHHPYSQDPPTASLFTQRHPSHMALHAISASTASVPSAFISGGRACWVDLTRRVSGR
jgi:hypothetical protein